jgi:hypothetical protein
MINFDPKNPVFYYKLGYSYLNTINKTDSAIINLKKAKKFYSDKYRAEVSKFDIEFYLARAYRIHKDIDSSIIILENLRKQTLDTNIINIINQEIDVTRKYVTNLFTIDDLDSVINSNYSEHSPLYSPKDNILMFTSRRYNKNSTKYPDGQYDEDIYYSKWKNNKWSKPKLMSVFDTPFNDATASIIPQNGIILLYKDDENGSIYISRREGNTWGAPKKMPRPINSRYRETHASMTNDGKQIFFTSNRPGGLGGLDIWTSRLQDDGKWSKPVNLGDAINTAKDEESPNISGDGKVLYFSSEGRGGFGGFDIFKSTRTQFNTWTIAKNLGYPINSVGDDIFFTPIANTDKAFYSSYRYGSKGNSDIFLVYLDSAGVKKKTINYGFVLDSTENPLDSVVIEIIDHSSGEMAIARPAENGKFIFITVADTTYTIKIFRKEKIVFVDNFTTSDTVPKLNFYKRIILHLE